MRPSAARNRRPSNDRLIHLELFTDFFNEIGRQRHFEGGLVTSALPSTPDVLLPRNKRRLGPILLWKSVEVVCEP